MTFFVNTSNARNTNASSLVALALSLRPSLSMLSPPDHVPGAGHVNEVVISRIFSWIENALALARPNMTDKRPSAHFLL